MSEVLVTGKSKKYHTALATGLGDGDFTGLGLEVAKGLPAIVSIAQLSPKLGNGGSRFPSRQGLYKLSCRHRGEKTFDFLTVAFHLWQQGLKLNHQCQHKFRLGSNNVFGNGQLSLTKLLPKLGRARLAQMMVTLGKSVPAPAVKFRESLRSGIRLEKIAPKTSNGRG